MSLAILKTLFAQKTWANAELFDAMHLVDPVQHAEPLHTATRTLNHIHVVDRIFRAHLLGEAHGYTQTNTDETPALGDLHFAAAETDHWFETYVAGLSESALAESLSFQFTDGDAGRMTREEMLFHVLAHGSYHRGNVGQVLKGIGMAPPRDLLTKFLHQREPARRQPA
ncbi:DNA damage-inducible protein DinB [Comamonadaceae bacterium]